jgi:hypothetical protein
MNVQFIEANFVQQPCSECYDLHSLEEAQLSEDRVRGGAAVHRRNPNNLQADCSAGFCGIEAGMGVKRAKWDTGTAQHTSC